MLQEIPNLALAGEVGLSIIRIRSTTGRPGTCLVTSVRACTRTMGSTLGHLRAITSMMPLICRGHKSLVLTR
jgi:hypothetical protein